MITVDKRVSMCLCLGMRREFDRTSKSSSYPLINPNFSDWLFALEEFSWLLEEMEKPGIQTLAGKQIWCLEVGFEVVEHVLKQGRSSWLVLKKLDENAFG